MSIDDTQESTHDFVDLGQALEILGVSRPTLYRWLRDGRLQGFRVGRQWRFSRSALDEFVRGQPPARDGLEHDIGEVIGFFRERAEQRRRSRK